MANKKRDRDTQGQTRLAQSQDDASPVSIIKKTSRERHYGPRAAHPGARSIHTFLIQYMLERERMDDKHDVRDKAMKIEETEKYDSPREIG